MGDLRCLCPLPSQLALPSTQALSHSGVRQSTGPPLHITAALKRGPSAAKGCRPQLPGPESHHAHSKELPLTHFPSLKLCPSWILPGCPHGSCLGTEPRGCPRAPWEEATRRLAREAKRERPTHSVSTCPRAGLLGRGLSWPKYDKSEMPGQKRSCPRCPEWETVPTG